MARIGKNDAIFEPYFTTNGVGEGMGLGLAVVRGIVEGMGGKISVESARAIGIKAFAYKPIVKADLAATVRKVLDEART